MELNDVPISNARQSLVDAPLYGCCLNDSIRVVVVVVGVLEVSEGHRAFSGWPKPSDTLQTRWASFPITE